MLSLHEYCMRLYFNFFQHSIMFLLCDAFQSSGHGFIWPIMGQDVSLYLISPLDSEIPVCKNSSNWFPLLYTDVCFFPFLYESFYIWGPRLPLKRVYSSAPSFLGFCFALLQSGVRESWKVVRSLSSSSSASWLGDLGRVSELSWGSASPPALPAFRECPWAIVSVNIHLKQEALCRYTWNLVFNTVKYFVSKATVTYRE